LHLALDYILILTLHIGELALGLGYLGRDLLLYPLGVLKYLLHRIGGGGPVLLEDLTDLVDAAREVLDVRPLPECLRPPDQVLHVVVLREVRILQVLVVPQQERDEVQGQIRFSLHLRGYHTVDF
jgi:hypothetical protein